MRAQCQCGQLHIDLSPTTPAVVACHCVACQRRTGAPLGVLAYYPASELSIEGQYTRFIRVSDEGRPFTTSFCPICGSSVFAVADKHPLLIGVAVGAFGDPNFHPPIRSVWEQTKHQWLTVVGNVEHLPKGRG